MSVYLFNSFFSASLYESVKVSAKFKGWMSNGEMMWQTNAEKNADLRETKLWETPKNKENLKTSKTSAKFSPEICFSLSLLISPFSFSYFCYTHSLTFVSNRSLCLFFFNIFFYLSCVHYCLSIFPSNRLPLTFPSITLSLFFISSYNSSMLVCLFFLSFFAILFTFCSYLLSEEETQSVPISLNVSLPQNHFLAATWKRTENWKLKKKLKKSSTSSDFNFSFKFLK
jgi:hypothetical protein